MVAKKSNKKRQEEKSPKIPRSDKRLFNKIRLEIKGSEKEVLILRAILNLVENLGNSDQWFSLGLLLSNIEKYDCANEVFNRVVTLNPSHSKAWRAKTHALSRLKRVNEAEESYKRALGVIGAKPKEVKEIKELAEYIDELVTETEKRRDNLDIANLNSEDIEIIVPDIENIDGFIADLLNYIARDENEAKNLLSQLNIPENSIHDHGKRE